jgi:nucleoside-diphosphate kinase
MREQTLVILKPDVTARGLVGEIVTRFEHVGLKLVAMKMLMAPLDVAKEHYKKDDEWLIKVGTRLIQNMKLDPAKEDPKKHGQKVVDDLAKDLTLYPVIAFVLEGHNTVALVRKMVGDTSPENAMPGTIRGDYSQDSYALANASNRPVINLIHASDSVENAKKEIALWFKKAELIEWVKPDEHIHFRRY